MEGNNIFTAYSIKYKKSVEVEIIKKIRTDVCGHFTYIVIGIDEEGINHARAVSKSQWDRFDVAIEERQISKHIQRRKKREMSMNGYHDSHGRLVRKKTLPSKNNRRVYDEEIEKWLLENSGLEFEKITKNEPKE